MFSNSPKQKFLMSSYILYKDHYVLLLQFPPFVKKAQQFKLMS